MFQFVLDPTFSCHSVIVDDLHQMPLEYVMVSESGLLFFCNCLFQVLEKLFIIVQSRKVDGFTPPKILLMTGTCTQVRSNTSSQSYRYPLTRFQQQNCSGSHTSSGQQVSTVQSIHFHSHCSTIFLKSVQRYRDVSLPSSHTIHKCFSFPQQGIPSFGIGQYPDGDIMNRATSASVTSQDSIYKDEAKADNSPNYQVIRFSPSNIPLLILILF